MNTAVAFFTFNRLDAAMQVFERIRQAQPPRLLLVSDGPRSTVEGEEEKVKSVRDYIESHIDWECEVLKNYAPSNMGCGHRISSGLDWVFSIVDEAMIIEDDCIPEDGFFRFCEEMLEHYRDDDRVMAVCGCNMASDYDTEYDYLFTRGIHTWGWASWRRAWELFDFDMLSWPEHRKDPIWKKYLPLNARWFFTSEFEVLYRHLYDVWDYQLMYAGMINDRLMIVPCKSLVTNVGFSEEATNTKTFPQGYRIQNSEFPFPITYRDEVKWDEEFDRLFFKRVGRYGWKAKIKLFLGLDVNVGYVEAFQNLFKRKRKKGR